MDLYFQSKFLVFKRLYIPFEILRIVSENPNFYGTTKSSPSMSHFRPCSILERVDTKAVQGD